LTDKSLDNRLPELIEINDIVAKYGELAKPRIEAVVSIKGYDLPIYSFAFGVEDPSAPTILLVGGVHGLERIGTRVLLAYLRNICELLTWDDVIKHKLSRCRLLFYPLVNPGGMLLQSRSNANGVDLMRNAPIEATKKHRYGLVGGHRVSPRLPWYRGLKNAPMELESETLCHFVKREVWPSRVSIVLDVHSGFGVRDRIWFPYARVHEPFPHIAEAYSLRGMLNTTYPHHVYKFEPQSKHYTVNGDLWDYLYDSHRASQKNIFMPFCLELGSWLWVKKNPRQLFSMLGIFNPIIPHRRQRTLRRHILLFDFLFRAVISPEKWAYLSDTKREEYMTLAVEKWYQGSHG
jgi:hypothetical protein